MRCRTFLLIATKKQPAFAGCKRLSKNRVIANQPEGWCGDLPAFAGNPGFLTKKCCFFMGDCHATAPAGAYRAQPPKAALGA